MALETSTTPVFFAKVAGVETFVPFLGQMSILQPGSCRKTEGLDTPEAFLDDVDRNLATVWLATKKFCVLVNRAASSKRKLPEATLLQAMASITYRLLHRRYAAHSFDETLRLALLAFCSRTFLQLPTIRIEDTCLPSAYRECLLSIGICRKASSRILLWLQTIGIVAVFGQADHAWLKPLLRSSIEGCGVESWSELADIMNSFIWIGLVFDRPGRDIFSNLMS